MGHLRLVKPAAEKRGRHRRVDPFTPDEQARLRAALRNARPKFGSWRGLADALGVSDATVELAARRAVSGELAVRLARALGVPVESLYRAPTDAATCPHCGARRAS
jgi:hypothetical protein